jgi:hypothetical protein
VFARHAGPYRQRAIVRVVFQDDVDHAGNRIGAVLGRCAVAQHFDALDGVGRDRRNVGAAFAAARGSLGVDQRTGVLALAVNQDQRAAGTHVADLVRIEQGGGIVDRRLHGVKRWHAKAEGLVQRVLAGLGQFLGRKNVDRDRGIDDGALGTAAAGGHDDDLLDVVARCRGCRRVLGRCDTAAEHEYRDMNCCCFCHEVFLRQCVSEK